MAEIWGAVTAAGIGAAVSIGEYASAPGAPAEPNLAASSAALSNTNAQLLPLQRGMAAAAQNGTSFTFSLPPGMSPNDLQIPQTTAGYYDTNGDLISTDPLEFQTSTTDKNGTKTSGQSLPPGVTWKAAGTPTGGIPITENADGTYTANFTGYGTADTQSQIATQEAQDQLAQAKAMDPQFIASALAQEAQADPQSVAARAAESNLIQQQISRPLNSPVSDLLNSQVQDTLNAANNNGLTGLDQSRLNAAVTSALGSRGGSSGPVDLTGFANPLTQGFAGEARQAGAAGAAQGFLSSGSDPEDIEYRRDQQNLGNLSAEVAGKTPQSQFGSLSGAQTGPTPTMTAPALPTLPGGQGQAADQNAINQWGTQLQYQQGQANPWMTGLSSLINVAGAAGAAGYKPLSNLTA